MSVSVYFMIILLVGVGSVDCYQSLIYMEYVEDALLLLFFLIFYYYYFLI